MRILYIAGPYRSTTEWGVEQNIAKAEAIALACWRKGWAVFCPHKNTAHFGGAADDSIWLQGDLEFLIRSDALLAIPGWEKSEGAKREVAVAESIGIPVFTGADIPRPEELSWPKRK